MIRSEGAIGMFDSGIGGLTVMREIIKKLPHEQVIYFGDTARVPYGDKSAETISRYAIENAIFLMEQSVKLIVVACNTASAFSLERLSRVFNIPFVGVIHPGVEKAVRTTRNKKIAVLGTKGTIRSGAYQAEIKKRLPDAAIFPISCPLFVPLVEEGFLTHPAAELIVSEYLKVVEEEKIDTVLLGCTHYPLLKDLIQKKVGDRVELIDSASCCAEEVDKVLSEKQIKADNRLEGMQRFFVSDDPEKFEAMGQAYFGRKILGVELKKS